MARIDTNKLDEGELSRLTEDELDALEEAIGEERKRRLHTVREEAADRMREIARELGMTPEEVLGLGAGKRRKPRKARAGKALYRHPDDPTKTWSGRGRKPGWIDDLLAAGRTLEDLRG